MNSALPEVMCKLVGSKKNLLVLCNEFGFTTLNPFSVGFKRFVLVLTHYLVVLLFLLFLRTFPLQQLNKAL